MVSTRFGCSVILLAYVVVGATFRESVAEDSSQPSEKVLDSFTIPKDGDAIVLPVRLGQHEILMVVDTGSSHHVFDQSLKPELGDQQGAMTGQTTGGPLTLARFKSPSLTVGKLGLSSQEPVFCTDLAALREVLGRDVRGILGTASLKSFIVRIDFDNGRLEFLAPDSPVNKSWGASTSLSFSPEGVPQATVAIGGIDCSANVDTGCNGISVSKAQFHQLLLQGKATFLKQTSTITPAGDRTRSLYVLEKLSVGRYEHSKLIGYPGEYDIVGLSVLSRYQATFDFPRRQIYLKQGARFDVQDRTDLSGMHLIRKDGQTAVRHITENSPAEQARIKPGDHLIRLQGREASSYSMFELRNVFQSEGKRTLTLSRADITTEVTMDLK